MINADLTSAILDTLVMGDDVFPTTLDGAILHGAKLANSNLAGASLAGADLTQADLSAGAAHPP